MQRDEKEIMFPNVDLLPIRACKLKELSASCSDIYLYKKKPCQNAYTHATNRFLVRTVHYSQLPFWTSR